MSKELEVFINDVRKAIKSIPSRPPITLKNANIVGIKLNSKNLKQLENEAHSQTLDINNLNSPEYLMGIRIYKDESIDAPRYIVEGEVELNNTKPNDALNELELVENWIKDRELEISNVIEPSLNTIKQALIKAQEQQLKDKAFELIILKNVDVNEIRPNATAKAYNSKVPYYRRPLTDDEFRFLKEMVHRLDCEEVVFELPKEY